MKKIKLSTAKLQLNKEKITELSNDQMGMINGGDGGPAPMLLSIISCVTYHAGSGCSGCNQCGSKGTYQENTCTVNM